MRLMYNPAELRWDLHWHDVLLRRGLQAGVLLTEYFGPMSDASALAPPGDDLFHERYCQLSGRPTKIDGPGGEWSSFSCRNCRSSAANGPKQRPQWGATDSLSVKLTIP